MTSEGKLSAWVETAGRVLTDLRLILTAVLALGAGGGSMWALADVGGADHVTGLQADSIAKANDAPIVRQLKRQDTALIDINFKLDVMMTDEQKRRADSLKRAALRNINYGGTP